MDAVVNYSANDLLNIKYQVDTLYIKLAKKSAKKVLYATTHVDIALYRELFLYKWAIEDYVINNMTPSPTNPLTPEEFTCIVQKIKTLSC